MSQIDLIYFVHLGSSYKKRKPFGRIRRASGVKRNSLHSASPVSKCRESRIRLLPFSFDCISFLRIIHVEMERGLWYTV